MKFLLKTTVFLFIFLSTVPVSAQWLYGKASIGNHSVSINGNLYLKSGGELYLQEGTLNLNGNYGGESGSKIYLSVNENANGFLNISGTAIDNTEIIPEIFPDWDGSRINLIKAKYEKCAIDAFKMQEIQTSDYIVRLKYEKQGNELIWYIEKEEINRCLPLIVGLGIHTLLVNNNSETNGGYKFDYYYWYKNGVLIKEGSHDNLGGSYYTGGKELETDADYTVEVVSNKGEHFFSCPFHYEKSVLTLNVNVFPNPVHRGEKAYIQIDTGDFLIFENSFVGIYDTLGQQIGKTETICQMITTLKIPSKTGIYILRFSAKDCVTNIKLIVK